MASITRTADSSISSSNSFQRDTTSTPIEYTTKDLPLETQEKFNDHLATGIFPADPRNITITTSPPCDKRFDESFPIVDEPEDMDNFVPERAVPEPDVFLSTSADTPSKSDLKTIEEYLANEPSPPVLPRCIAMSGHLQPRSNWLVNGEIAPIWKDTNLSYEADLLGLKKGPKRRWRQMDSLKSFVERSNRELLQIKTAGQESDEYDMLHLSKPIDACYKTLSEAATIHFVCESTSVEQHVVPRVISYNAHHKTGSKNLEWIYKSLQESSLIQTKGSTSRNLAQVWPTLSLDAKKGYLEQIADINMSLFNRTHKVIGSIYFGRDIAELDKIQWPGGRSPLKQSNVMRTLSQRKPWVVSRLVLKDLIRRDRNIVPAIDRGPYATTFEFYSERLRILIGEYNKEILQAREMGDKAEVENLEKAREVVARVGQRLSHTLVRDPKPETFRLYRDWSLSDFVLLENGKLHALDWDYTYFAPAWFACRTPDFLRKESSEVRDHYFNRYKKWSPLYDRLLSESKTLLELDKAIRIVDERRPTSALEAWLDDMDTR